MELMTKELEDRFPGLYATDGKDSKDVPIISKFFDPCSGWSWYAVEYDPDSRVFFGLVRGFETELGYFSLDELQLAKGALGLGIERDLYFGEHMLAEAMEESI
ncbi:DUF2958 domain-containing protein [Candidatus Pacearchaeota archaeon]|nr:DUF2958 domain-containing protein [Candidatus Pacearchaeota archaeon]